MKFGDIDSTVFEFGQSQGPPNCLCYVYSDLTVRIGPEEGSTLWMSIHAEIGLKCSPSALEDVEEFEAFPKAPPGFLRPTGPPNQLNLHVRRYR